MQEEQGRKRITLKLGSFRFHSISTGTFALDGGAMFGTVPKTMWNRQQPADEFNRILMEARALLIVDESSRGGRRILVDTGVGSHFVEKYGEKVGAKFGEIYKIDQERTLEGSLRAVGLTVDEITDVILTHLHFDHAGGATTWKDGRLRPSFPRATYYLQQEHLETAQNPNVRERASFFAANYQPLMDAGQLQILKGPQENLLPHISLSVSYGHTQAMQLVHFHHDGGEVIYCADLIPTASHVRRAWIMGYDLQPLVIIEEKERVLKGASSRGSYLFFEHDPYCEVAKIVEEKGDFRIEEPLFLK